VAAWLARIGRAVRFAEESRPEERAEDRINRRKNYADSLKGLADRARAVCVEIIDRPGPATTSGLPGPGLPSPQDPAAGGRNPGPDKSSADQGTGP